MMGAVGLNVPAVDVEAFWPQYLALHEAIQSGLISSCHAVSRGGLAVHLAMVAMGGELGMDILLPLIPGFSGLTAGQALYSETCGRFVMTVAPGKREAFEKIFSGMKIGRAGVVTDSNRFSVKDGRGKAIIDEDVHELKHAWKKPFGELI
jgi:phosphoribosylformylglycinamidine synthase